ncbi:MAG TPA: TIGR03936 family radical SAM-associated protein, partial [bacterium]|nr:TIGR03936 family radical SAM-associated protein [bacterium]
GDALPVGLSSEGEYADLRLRAEMSPDVFVERMNAAQAAGIQVKSARTIETSVRSLTAHIAAASYQVRLGRLGFDSAEIEERVRAFLAADTVETVKQVKQAGGRKAPKVMRFDVRALVESLVVREVDGEPALEMVLGRRSGNLARPRDVLRPLLDLDADRLLEARVHKLDSFVETDAGLVSVESLA